MRILRVFLFCLGLYVYTVLSSENQQQQTRGSRICQNEHGVRIVIGSSIVMSLIGIYKDVVNELVQLHPGALKEEEKSLLLMGTMSRIISRQVENHR